jgi:hypothetical protein
MRDLNGTLTEKHLSLTSVRLGGGRTLIPGESLGRFRYDYHGPVAGLGVQWGKFVHKVIVLGLKGQGHQVRTSGPTSHRGGFLCGGRPVEFRRRGPGHGLRGPGLRRLSYPRRGGFRNPDGDGDRHNGHEVQK